jgi:hypothetical protein
VIIFYLQRADYCRVKVHRVEVDVASHFLPTGVIFDDHRIESALEEVSSAVVPVVEPDVKLTVTQWPGHGR